GRQVRSPRAPGHIICGRRTPSLPKICRRKICCRKPRSPHHDHSAMMSWLSEWLGGGTAVVEAASLRDARRLAQLHGESFHRGWGESEFEAMLTERNTLVHRLKVGRKLVGFA